MTEYAPEPNRGLIKTVYIILAASESAMTAHQVAQVTIDRHAIQNPEDAPLRIEDSLRLVRQTLSSGKGFGYLVDMMDQDQRYYQIATLQQYELRRKIVAQREDYLTKQKRPWWINVMDWFRGE